MNPHSIRADRPVDPVTIDILRAVAEEARAEGIDYMLVGATARDVLLTHVFGIASRRATYDVDFAVTVKDRSPRDAKAEASSRQTRKPSNASTKKAMMAAPLAVMT